MKKCTRCNRYKDKSCFQQRTNRPIGQTSSWCKLCLNRVKRQWYLENRTSEIKKNTVYGEKHGLKSLSDSALYRRKLRNAVLVKYKRKCKRCGFKDVRALQIDHVFGNGRQELKNMGNGSSQYPNRVLHDTKGRYQLLCANCDIIKYVVSKEN